MGGFDQRIEVIVKMQKSRGRGGCDARIEAILKMQNAKKKKKKKSGEGVYVNQEFKLF